MLVRLPLDNPEAVWAAMQQRLIAGDVDGAVLCFSALSGDSYREFYLSITRQELSAIIGQIPPIRPVTLTPDVSQYRFDQEIEGYLLTFPVNFTRENGQGKYLNTNASLRTLGGVAEMQASGARFGRFRWKIIL